MLGLFHIQLECPGIDEVSPFLVIRLIKEIIIGRRTGFPINVVPQSRTAYFPDITPPVVILQCLAEWFWKG